MPQRMPGKALRRGGVRGGVRFMQLWIGTDTRLLTENPQRSARSPLETRTDGDTENGAARREKHTWRHAGRTGARDGL
jgi:hypothetical protein